MGAVQSLCGEKVIDVEVIRLNHPFAEPPAAERQAMAIGFFDGVHAGHRAVLQKAVSHARRSNIKASVMTFDPHPREVLGGDEDFSYITPLADKLEKFAGLGLDRCYVLAFNKALSELSPAAFVEQVLLPLGATAVAVGFNFTFGRFGRGTADSLREFGQGRFEVTVVRPHLQDGAKVSSTLIREMIHQGSVERAGSLLGRPYRITGKVVPGLGRGRTIGIPTANLEPSDRYVIPGNGVYAVDVHVDGTRYRGVMNIGLKPTFADNPPQPTLEVHLLDFSGDLYGRRLDTDFLARLRDERKFSGPDELVAQIHRDIDKARQAAGH